MTVSLFSFLLYIDAHVGYVFRNGTKVSNMLLSRSRTNKGRQMSFACFKPLYYSFLPTYISSARSSTVHFTKIVRASCLLDEPSLALSPHQCCLNLPATAFLLPPLPLILVDHMQLLSQPLPPCSTNSSGLQLNSSIKIQWQFSNQLQGAQRAQAIHSGSEPNRLHLQRVNAMCPCPFFFVSPPLPR
jgi:hypothetical protein